MSHTFLLNANFHTFLITIDKELADKTHLAGCPCGGNLHRSDYPRSPFGLSEALRAYYQERYSFCCALCRKRTTAPSVRFFGRRWFPAPLFILLSALSRGATESRCSQIQRLFGMVISPSTWKRWRRWWRASFTTSHFWIQAQGIISPAHLNGPFPGKLLSLFIGHLEERLVSLLKFLTPMTVRVLQSI